METHRGRRGESLRKAKGDPHRTRRQREPGAVAELGGTVERGGSWGYSHHGSTMRNTSNISISVSISISISVYLSIHLIQSNLIQSNLIQSNLIQSNLNLPIYLSTYLPIYLSTYLPIYLSTYLPIYLSTYLPIYLSTYLPIYLSTYLSNPIQSNPIKFNLILSI